MSDFLVNLRKLSGKNQVYGANILVNLVLLRKYIDG